MATHPKWVRGILSESDLDAVAAAVERAESRTAAEIRVHLEPRVRGTGGDPLRRARAVFAALGMQRTEHRAGVLIYLALEDRRLAIVGDEAIHAHVGDEYWARVRDAMVARLRAGAIGDAIIAAVAEIGDVLARRFPRRAGDVDELSDEVSLGE